MAISNLFSMIDYSIPVPPPNSDGTKSFQLMSESEINAAMEGYYKQALKGDTGKVPTEALQAMASDSTCDKAAYEAISKELEKRGEPLPSADYSTMTTESGETKSLYDMTSEELDEAFAYFYEMASAGATWEIPTEALQAMAADPACSEEAYYYITSELEYREEPVDPNDPNDPYAQDEYGGLDWM